MDQRTISLPVLKSHFPSSAVYRQPRDSQNQMLAHIAKYGSVLIEASTGAGKSAVEYTVAKYMRKHSEGMTFIITPTKAILDQISLEFPDLPVVMGRNEHPCLYYQPDERISPEGVQLLQVDPENPRADDIPCSFLKECPHRVDQATGETFEERATPCPYLLQKFVAKQSRLVLSTMSFYLFTHLFSKEFETTGLVIDEPHQLPNVIRNALSYDITDRHLSRSEEILKPVAPKVTQILRKFRRRMILIAGRKQIGEAALLKPEEVLALLDILNDIDIAGLATAIKDAIKSGQINPREDRVTLKKLETLVRDLRRYISTFGYSVPGERSTGKERGALNYICAFQRKERGDDGKGIQTRLAVKCYYVVGLIKTILPEFRVSLSATIGDPQIFGYEAGIRDPFLSIGSDFPVANSRIYMPTDTPDLSVNRRSDRDLPKTLRKMARSCKRFADKGIRSLVVVVSNNERDRFMKMAEEEGLDAVSYGNGVTAKDAAHAFKNGKGSTLVGTASNYSEGIDLPKGIAPVIFVLRPSYPNPTDPGTKFEEQRLGGQRWAIWNYRAMQQAIQVRGRNIRSSSDVGVTIFMSQQFRRFVSAALPQHLKPVYKGTLTFEQAEDDAMKLLLPK